MDNQITFNDLPRVLEQLSIKMDLVVNSLQLNKDGPEKDPPIDLARACEILMVSKPTLYRYCSERKIKYYKREKKLYFLESDLMSFIQDGKKRTAREIKNETLFLNKK